MDGSTDTRTSHLTIALLRVLAKGRPVEPAQVLRIAVDIGLPGSATQAFLAQNAERDDGGNVVGLTGLSLAEHPHRFVVGGREFSTWCAWDTLFLPSLLGESASVASHDPLSGRPVRAEVSPDRLVSIDPAAAVVSFVQPDMSACNDVAAIQESFCNLVHFFESDESARLYLARRGIKGRVLAAAQAFQLGQERHADLIAVAGMGAR